MCMQCAAAATVAVGSASGIRVWLGAHRRAWLTPRRLRTLTIALGVMAVIGSGIAVGGSG